MERKDGRLASSRFVLPPDEVRSLMASSGATDPADILPSLVPTALSLARPPISSFPVGAAGLGSSGAVYLGCNLEFPGLPLHHSVHAEQFLVANALLACEPRLVAIAVSAAPCGHCRQFLQELRFSADLKILVTSDAAPRFRPLVDFLPRPFGPVDLLAADVPLLLEPRANAVKVGSLRPKTGSLAEKVGSLGEKVGSFAANGWGNGHGDPERELVEAAAVAARGAHAPYSGCPAGCAVTAGEGKVFAGPYMESAAYNPSLGPIQAAMVAYVVGGGGGWEEIKAAALVETEGAKVSQEGTARVFFEKVAPAARFSVHLFKMEEGGGDDSDNKNV